MVPSGFRKQGLSSAKSCGKALHTGDPEDLTFCLWLQLCDNLGLLCKLHPKREHFVLEYPQVLELFLFTTGSLDLDQDLDLYRDFKTSD